MHVDYVVIYLDITLCHAGEFHKALHLGVNGLCTEHNLNAAGLQGSLLHAERLSVVLFLRLFLVFRSALHRDRETKHLRSVFQNLSKGKTDAVVLSHGKFFRSVGY